MPSLCVLASETGTRTVVHWDGRSSLTTLLGVNGHLTFVGAVDELQLFIVAVAREGLSGCEDDSSHDDCPVNPLALSHPHLFMPDDPPPRGAILFVGSDENAQAMDVDVAALDALLMM